MAYMVVPLAPPAATELGREAYVSGMSLGDCPYAPGSVFQVLWIQAWVQEDDDFRESTLALVRQRGRGE